MLNLAFVLACLAFTSHGRRVQRASARLPEVLKGTPVVHADTHLSLQSACPPLKMLARLLLRSASRPATAFMPAGSRFSMTNPFRTGSQRWNCHGSCGPIMSDTDLPIVIAGAGLHGAALAYYLTQRGERPILIDKVSVAAAASGKGGGFLARDWGSGPTVQLHKVSFALHEELASELGITSYRRIPVLSVAPGDRTAYTQDLCPWLDGELANSDWMDTDGGAQVDPRELCTKLVDAAVAAGATLKIGSVEGIEPVLDPSSESGMKVGAVKVDGELIPCRAFACTMGPWSAKAADWFAIPVPMTGIKSTSIVFKAKEGDGEVEPFALFCGEDHRFGTHLEVYPRASGEVYLCGIGGSEYVDGSRLVAGEYPPGEVYADPDRVEAATKSFSMMSKRLGGKPDVAQACMRPCPPDAIPYMGRVPTLSNAYISAGHNCWGILWSPVSGKAMSELILDGEASCVDLSPFDPGRFTPTLKGRGRKRGTEPVGEQW